MTQYPNQRVMTTEQGQVDYAINPSIISAVIHSTETGTLVPGQSVKIYDVAGGVPKVVARDADSDAVFAFIIRNPKDASYEAGDSCEIAIAGSVIYMTAAAAIARGATVEAVVASKKVQTVSTGSPVGIALDKAAADGDLIRVYIIVPSPVFGTLGIAAALTVGTTLGVTGATTLGGTLAITGDVTPAANVFESYVAYSAGAGALPVTKDVIFLTTGGAEALTLADGTIGQKLKIIMVSDGGAGTLTPAHFGNGTTITFDDDGDSVELIFDGTNWWTIGTPTATVA